MTLPVNSHDRLHGSALFRASRTPIVVNRFCLRGSHQTHDHDFMEIAVVAGGSGVHHSIHGAQEISGGDAFLLRAGAWHSYRKCRGLQIINCCFGSELLSRELAWLFDEPALNYLLWTGPLSLERRGIVGLHLEPDSLARCTTLLETLERAGEDQSGFAHSEQIARLLLLLSHLARHLDGEHRVAIESSRRAHPAVLEAIRVLESSPSSDWNLKDLATRVHLDRFYLARLFKSHTGLAPLEYLSRLRAERAAGLLIRTDQSIGEIGAQVGWSDPNYFARRFKSHFGLNASEYRRQFAVEDDKE